MFRSFNTINGITPTHIRNDVLGNYNYRYDPKLGQRFVAIIITPCSCNDFTTHIYLPWDTKIEDACNKPRHGRVFNWNSYLIIGSHNNCIIMNFIDDWIGGVRYEHTNRTILGVNFTNMSLAN